MSLMSASSGANKENYENLKETFNTLIKRNLQQKEVDKLMKLEEINYKIMNVKSQVEQLKDLKYLKGFVKNSQNNMELFVNANTISFQIK